MFPASYHTCTDLSARCSPANRERNVCKLELLRSFRIPWHVLRGRYSTPSYVAATVVPILLYFFNKVEHLRLCRASCGGEGILVRVRFLWRGI